MSKTKRGGAHNPSPYMRRFQLPNLTFSNNSGYDELLSPLETDAKHELIAEKNRQLSTMISNYFAPPGTSNPEKQTANCPKNQEISKVDDKKPTKPSEIIIPPPVPPHRPPPRQRLIEIEKIRMFREISELERRSREMLDLIMK
uniref:Uncharacterized protein n=1 Tax=Panagrolaimus sp. JU765 TaxID=591449 RepID=A0AC34Q8D9_9BILA